MAHYAKVLNGIVQQVIVAEESFMNSFVDSSPGEWIQTSYNTKGGVHLLGGTPFRKNYAGIGYIYDSERDAFYEPQPYASWIFDEEKCVWNAPLEYPQDGKPYRWNEESQQWVEITE